MKNKIFGSFKVFIILVVLGLICLPFLKQQALKQVKGNYLKRYVKIEEHKAAKAQDNLSAKIALVIDNSGNMILGKIPLKISYLDARKQFISSDEVDLLKMSNEVVLANSKKSFIVDVTIPDNCRFIIPQIMY